MRKREKISRMRHGGMNEKLVEQAMRKMSPTAFHKMLDFLKAWEKSNGKGMATALLGMTEGERREVVKVVKIALGEDANT